MNQKLWNFLLMVIAFAATTIMLNVMREGLGVPRHVWTGIEIAVFLVLIVPYCRMLSKQAMLEKGDEARKKKDHADALKIAMDGIAKYPKDADFYVLASAVYGGLRQSDESIEMASKAIVLKAKSALAWNNRASAYLSRGDLKNALHDACHAADLARKDLLRTGSALPFQTRAAIYTWTCSYEKALADADHLAERFEPARGFYIRAVVMTSMNRSEEAIEWCDKALAATKYSRLRASVLAARALACDALGRREEANTDSDLAIKEEPEIYLHRVERSHLFARAGKHKEAAIELAAVARLDLSILERSLLQSNKARLQVLVGADPGEACRLAEDALKVLPEYPMFLCTHAWAQKAAGNHSAALADLSRAIEIDQYHAEAYWLRSEVYAALGESERSQADRDIAHKFGYRPYRPPNSPSVTDTFQAIRLREKQPEART